MIGLSAAEFHKFAPHAKQQYVEGLMAVIPEMREAGILDNCKRLSAFLGQCAAETDCFVILRESLSYTTVGAVRNAWRARASKHTDDWIKSNLLRNPVALGDWAYGGREGNRKGTTDGFDFRGGGPLQTTHANAVKAYCGELGVPFRSDALDDTALCWRFAILEWRKGNCNAYADRGDVLAIAKIINTGSATSGVKPNGMERRKLETTRALAIWGNAEQKAEIVEPTRLYAEPEVVTKTQAAAKSKSVKALLFGKISLGFGFLEQKFNLLPDISDSIESTMSPIMSIASALKLEIGAISVAIAVGCMLVVIFRHPGDKAAAINAEQEEASCNSIPA